LADVYLYAGFAIALVGLYLTSGLGVTCLVGGAVLFVAGGLQSRVGR